MGDRADAHRPESPPALHACVRQYLQRRWLNMAAARQSLADNRICFCLSVIGSPHGILLSCVPTLSSSLSASSRRYRRLPRLKPGARWQPTTVCSRPLPVTLPNRSVSTSRLLLKPAPVCPGFIKRRNRCPRQSPRVLTGAWLVH